MIDSAVQADPKKFYTYSQFQSAIVALKQTIITRRNFILNDSEMSNVTPLSVDQVSYAVDGVQWQSPSTSDAVDVVAQVGGAVNTASVWLYYGEGFTGPFSKIEMYDDGNHKDGAAGDGQYGAAIPGFGAGTYVRYYIEAIADDAAHTVTYEPKGAEHDVFLYQVEARIAANVNLVINELMASNSNTVTDNAGEYDDWIELHNLGSQALDIGGYFLTDKTDNLTKWEVPQGTMINGNDYLIIWADEDGSQGDLHANFKLSSGGEDVILLTPDTQIVDQISFGAQTTDMGYARSPNGTGSFVIQIPTFDQNNDNATAIEDESEFASVLNIYPNPATDHLIVKIDLDKVQDELFVFNALGQNVYRASGQQLTHIETSEWPAGMYVVRFGRQYKQLVIRR